MKLPLMVLLTVLCLSVNASFIDERLIDYSSLSEGEPQITEAEFNKRISEIKKVYAPIVRFHKGRLSLKGLWKNDRIIARATQMFGSWKIDFSGGLARRPELSGDGMTLIICHEIGHHLAGFPFYVGTPFGGYWAATEGQSDYYSTHVCAKNMWANETDLNASFALKVNPFAKNECDSVYGQQTERDLCYRTAVALESVILTMATLKKVPMPQYTTPDRSIATGTLENHPKTQCRFDTLFMGNLCAAKFNQELIPGKKTRAGRESVDAERESAINACSVLNEFTQGHRPACWFKSRL